MIKHTLFPLAPIVGVPKDRKNRLQSIESVDYETLGYLLSCHLIIEHYLDLFLATHSDISFDWQEAKLNFWQKTALIAKLHFPEPYNFPPVIKHLNKLRNKFSHNINATLSKTDLQPFRHFLKKCYKGKSELPEDPKELLNFFTNVTCAYLAGRITNRLEKQ